MGQKHIKGFKMITKVNVSGITLDGTWVNHDGISVAEAEALCLQVPSLERFNTWDCSDIVEEHNLTSAPVQAFEELLIMQNDTTDFLLDCCKAMNIVCDTKGGVIYRKRVLDWMKPIVVFSLLKHEQSLSPRMRKYAETKCEEFSELLNLDTRQTSTGAAVMATLRASSFEA